MKFPWLLGFPPLCHRGRGHNIGTTLLRPPLAPCNKTQGEGKNIVQHGHFISRKNVSVTMYKSSFISLKMYFKLRKPSLVSYMRFVSHPKLLAFWLWLYDMPPPSHRHSGYPPTSTKWRKTKKLMEWVQVLKHQMETQTDFCRDVLTEKEREGQRRKRKPRNWKRLGKKSWRLWDTLFQVYDLMREKLTLWMWLKEQLATFRSFMRKSHREWLSIKKRWLNSEP